MVILAQSPCAIECHFDASTIMGLVKFTAHPVPRHALSGGAGVVLFGAIFVSDGSESESNVSAAVSVRPFGIICVSADSTICNSRCLSALDKMALSTHHVFQVYRFQLHDVILTRRGECKPNFGCRVPRFWTWTELRPVVNPYPSHRESETFTKGA